MELDSIKRQLFVAKQSLFINTIFQICKNSSDSVHSLVIPFFIVKLTSTYELYL